MFSPRTGARWRVRTFRVPMFVIAAALIGLIAALATLQYKWLGRISDAERERMTANLGAHSTGLAQEFDQELTRAYATFQMELTPNGENLAAKLSTRYDRWLTTARHPRMVRDVYVMRQEGTTSNLQKYSPTSKFVEPVEWPEALRPIRDAIGNVAIRHTEAATRSLPNTFVFTAMPPQSFERVPALVIPMPVLFINHLEAAAKAPAPQRLSLGGMTAFVIVHLDRDYLAHEMLPAMVEQRFRSAGTAYEVAVVNTTTNDVVYTSDRAFAPAADSKADATADLFRVRLQEFGGLVADVRRLTTATTIRSPVTREGKPLDSPVTPRRSEVAESVEIHRLETPARGTPGAPVSFMVQETLGARERAAVVTGASAALSQSVQSGARWRLVVKHPSGSLEAAVNTARRRNILVSTSVMAMLGVSVGFLIVTTRRAQELARQQMEFVAAVSHELRTPLAVIRSAADNLAEGVVQDHPQVKKYGDLVRVEGRRLSEMVEQILELAGIQSGQRSFALGPVPILPLVHDVVRASSTLIDDAGIEVEVDIPEALPPVLGEEAAVRRVLQNLVGNAVKYGASGRWIGITARHDGREVTISVADRGIGIPAIEQSRIFDAFYRAPNVVDQQIQGAGLGLSLVQRIVEAHGGRISVRSTEGSGSEFTVHLPAASEEPITRTSGAADPAHRVS